MPIAQAMPTIKTSYGDARAIKECLGPFWVGIVWNHDLKKGAKWNLHSLELER
jgi:hypothetical protein